MEDKNIYEYKNHKGETVYGDPLEIEYRFDKAFEAEDRKTIMGWVFPGVDEETGELKGDEKQWVEGVMRIAPMVSKAFGIPVLDPATGEGMTREQLLRVYMDFWGWMNDVKKNTEEMQTCAPSTQA